MSEVKKAILLVNLGTPDAPVAGAVRRYLAEFLNDPHVIDIPNPRRFLLVNCIIIPFRLRKSTALYRRLWTPEGSPISNYLKLLQQKVAALSADTSVYAAMRYGRPSIRGCMKQLHDDGITHLTVLPLYPQYAVSTTETIFAEVRKYQSRMPAIKELHFIHQFYNHPAFLTSFQQRIESYDPASFDHLIFSYHSLPERHLDRIHPGILCRNCSCEEAMPATGAGCYKATAYETARRLAERLHLQPGKYSVAFQSRFAKKWIGPFTEDVVRQLARTGARRVLVVAPSFVADCLETIVEIGMEYRELFEKEGGDELVMAGSLNAEDYWAEAVVSIITNKEEN